MMDDFDESGKATVKRALQAAAKQRRATGFLRNLKKSGLDARKTFEHYEFGGFEWPQLLPKDDFFNCEFVKRAENVILYGNPGTGKTHLANAVGITACRIGLHVEFWATSAFVASLSAAFQGGKTVELFQRLAKLDLLILDEWGYLPVDSIGAQLLFRVISEFYERKSIVLTTNLVFSEWGNIFNDDKLTAAILDRMVHHSHFIQFSGESYRLRHSLMA